MNTVGKPQTNKISRKNVTKTTRKYFSGYEVFSTTTATKVADKQVISVQISLGHYMK